MSILEGLKKAAVEAAKAKDQVRLDAIRMATSAVHYREIEKRAPLSEAEISAVLQSLCKQRRESIEQFEKGGRSDLVAKETREIETLLAFLPRQLTREQVAEKARAVIQSLGATSPRDMGKVMKALTAELAGQADGGTISAVVREILK